MTMIAFIVQVDVKFMAENVERKSKYLKSRFPDVPVFEDAADLHKPNARCDGGHSMKVPEVRMCLAIIQGPIVF